MPPIPYTYTPLPLATGDRRWLQNNISQIRLLKLLPSEDIDAPISFVIRQDILSKEMDRTSFFAGTGSSKGSEELPKPPVYEALSYVWGDPKVRKAIRVSNEGKAGQEGELQVTVNLYSALQHLRLRDRPRMLWADAVCIDQSNVEERAQQVMIMGRIYALAKKVVVWLGEASMEEVSLEGNGEDKHEPPSNNGLRTYAEWNKTELVADQTRKALSTPPQNQNKGPRKIKSSDFLFDVFQELYDALVNWSQELDKLNTYVDQRYHKLDLDKSLGTRKKTAAQEALRHLLKRTWWTRSWIVQEVLMARQCIFVCGTKAVSWDVMGRTISLLLTSTSSFVRESDNPFSQLPSTIREQLKVIDLWTTKLNMGWNEIHKRTLSLDQLPNHLIRFGCFKCSDPRDKIFAFIGLVERGVRIYADYNLSTREVYMDVTRQHAWHNENLNIICRHHRGYAPTPESAKLKLPSWCPDWSRSDSRGWQSWVVSDDESERDLYFADGRTNFSFVYMFPNPWRLDPELFIGEGARLDVIASISDFIPLSAYDDDSWMDQVRAWEPNSIRQVSLMSKTSQETALRAYWRTLLTDKRYPTWRFSEVGDDGRYWQYDMCYLAFARHIEFGYWASSLDANMEKFKIMLHRTTFGMRFATTERGYYCMVPQAAEVGDTIVVLRGGSVPFVLREADRCAVTKDKEKEEVKEEGVIPEEVVVPKEAVVPEKVVVREEDIRDKDAKEAEKKEEEEEEEEELPIWTMKGTCYVHSMMDGVVFREIEAGKRVSEYFVIR
ncbi:hypothetical protein W97_02790 [Coniosporium apollinis CBS 100218]|uniref:Heterokaryon incompatibility domain-containing protein n=1 Tax=Coniosporium apollinis (strain CBS 100218) TaxID=1168221 RepID=R7YNU6_CONA1|nr:uncharacterized protein W97_02790 [Coniosporium apollinis CBS 100218]EON63562.1 hypothetical protein W97_02790 [Coniosporium apollinis CBS 100218]